ncbi:MAG: sulfatase-like hydrolase/transferase, partial [Erysipelotrichaceae bacterium]|nr:sulfatase-like hydrolase/transferase [Erysipelotrichaceae bacterium]
MKKRPHIIIFNPDEMRWDSMGHMGNPAARTPFLDRFAEEEAVSFSQAFCQNPVCVPSRCSFFTGLYPHTNGHRTMNHLLHPWESDLFAELKASGYQVWMNDRNDLYAGQIPGWFEEHSDVICYGGEKMTFNKTEKMAGFREGKEDLYSHYEGKLTAVNDAEPVIPDQEYVDAAADYIRSYNSEKPLCLFLGLLYPHVPYEVEEPYYSAIDRSKLPPRVRFTDCEGKSKIVESIRHYQDLSDMSEEEWDEIRSTYLGMCSKIDALFEELCRALKDAGMYDDSAIFFLSDHGDFAGDYDLTEKAQSAYEDCLSRVPLLIKPPKGEGLDQGVTDSLAELVDFYATALDYAGVDPGRTHFGRSLAPVVADRNTVVREYVHCEGGRLPEEKHCDEYHSFGPDGPDPHFVYWPKMMAQLDDGAHAKGTMIRSKEYKYIERISGENEFYCLKDDPREKHNRIADPACQEAIAMMKNEMLRWLMETSDTVPYTYDARFTNEMVWRKVRNFCPPEKEAEVRK